MSGVIGGTRSGRSASPFDRPSRSFPQFLQASFLEGDDAGSDESSFVFECLFTEREKEDDRKGLGPEFKVGGVAENFVPDGIE